MAIECEVCRSRTNPITGYCTEYNQTMCGECQVYHGKFSTTRDHAVLTSTKDTCSVHGLCIDYMHVDGTDVLAYCEKCREGATDCHDLINLTNFLENEAITEHKMNKLSENLNKKLKAMEVESRLLKKKKTTLERMSTETKQIRDTVNKLDGLFSYKLGRCQNELIETYAMEEKLANLAKRLEQMTSVLKVLKRVPVKVDKASILLQIKEILIKSQTILETSDSEEDSIGEECDTRAVLASLLALSNSLNSQYYTINELLHSEQNSVRQECGFNQELKEQDVVGTTVSESITEPKEVENDAKRGRKRLPSEKLEQYKELVDEKELDTLKSIECRKQSSIHINIDGDVEQCAITGLVELPDNKLLMADFNNLKLKLFGADGHIEDYHSFKQAPRDIASIHANMFAVTIPMEKCIQFVSICNSGGKSKISIGKRLDVASLCCGISVCDERIYTATQRPTRILVLNEHGETIDELAGIDRFERPTYTLFDNITSRIYVSDETHKCIYGFDSNTKNNVFRYNVEDPKAIAIDEDGNLFVADWDTTSVHLVSKDGAAIAQIKLEPRECPQKLYYNKTGRCLYVTLWESNRVRIFNLKGLGQINNSD